MVLWHIVLIALAISIDAFSMSFAVGSRVLTRRAMVRLSFHFGLFQGLMPLVGWVLGTQLSAVIGTYDHWIAFGLLAAISAHMFIESFKPPHIRKDFDPSRGLALMGLSISVSIDALGVGLGMGIMNTTIVIPCLIYGLFTWGMSYLGIVLSRWLKHVIGQRIETIGAIVLFIVALHLLRI